MMLARNIFIEGALLPILEMAFALFEMALLAVLAVLLVRVQNVDRARRRREMEVRWSMVLREFLIGDGDVDSVRAEVAPGEAGYFVDFLFQRIDESSEFDRYAIRRLAEPYLDDLIRAHGKSRDPERLARLLHTLGRMNPEAYREIIRDALRKSTSPLVRLVAARHLVEMPDSETSSLLVHRILQFNSWNQRLIEGILFHEGADISGALLKIWNDPNHDPRERVLAGDVLARFKSQDAVTQARKILERGDERDLVVTALRILATSGEHSDARLARKYLESEDPILRSHAIDSLANLGDEAEDSFRLEERLADKSSWVAVHAACALQKLGAIRTLVTHKFSHPEHAEMLDEVLAGAVR